MDLYNDNIDSDPGGRFRNFVDVERNCVYLKTGFLQFCIIFAVMQNMPMLHISRYYAEGQSNKFWGPIFTG